MDVKGLLMWGVFLLIVVAGMIISRRMKKQVEEKGIETTGVISRITDSGTQEEIDLQYYVRYRTADGEEVEGILSNPSSDLQEGQEVRLLYHPKYKQNARLIRE